VWLGRVGHCGGTKVRLEWGRSEAGARTIPRLDRYVIAIQQIAVRLNGNLSILSGLERAITSVVHLRMILIPIDAVDIASYDPSLIYVVLHISNGANEGQGQPGALEI